MEQLENKKKTCKIYVNWKDDVNPTEKKGLTLKDFLSFFPDGVACISLPRCVTLSHPPTSR